MDKTETKIKRALTTLILGQPFFGALALRLKIELVPGLGTADVDGTTLRCDPDYVDGLPAAKLVGLIAHEVIHCANRHHLRGGNRDAKRWNDACDYVVNPIVADAGLELPDGAMIDAAFAGMSAEKIYAALTDQAQQDQDEGQEGDPWPPQAGAGQDDQVDGEGQDGDPWPSGGEATGTVSQASDAAGNALSPAEQAAQEADWKVAVIQAANAAKAAGSLPGGAAMMAQAIKEPLVDWREALRRFMSAAAAEDYSWSRPNRRLVCRKIFMPSLRSEALGEIVIAIDDSGSITQRDLDLFAAEMTGVIEDARPAKVTVVYCDDQVHHVEDIDLEALPIKLQAQGGGGGTSFRPVFDWIEEQGIDPAAVVYLTDLDGYGDCFGEDPGYPILWASTMKTRAPFGDVLRLEA